MSAGRDPAYTDAVARSRSHALVALLVVAAVSSSSPVRAADPVSEPATTTQTPVDEPPARSKAWATLWTVGFTSGAVVVGALGATFDLAAPTSHNATFEGWDLVGPIAYASALGIASVGLFLNPLNEAPDE